MRKIFVTLLIILTLFGVGAARIFNWSLFKESKSFYDFTLYKEYGDVFYKKSGGSYEKLSSDEISLENRTYIRTENGTAHAILPDNSVISIGPNTELQVNFEGNNTRILQFLGNTWHRVQKLGNLRHYDVETSDMLASVRGTIFSIEVHGYGDNQVAEGYVIDSKVSVSQLAWEQNNKVAKDTADLVTGKYTLISKYTKDSKVTVTDIPEGTRSSNWYKRNLILDERFKRQSQNPAEFIKSLKDDEQLMFLRDTYTPDSSFTELFKASLNASDALTFKAYFTNLDNSSNKGSICTFVNSAEFRSYLSTLDTLKSKDEQNYYFKTAYTHWLINACKDGSLTDEEIKGISNFSSLFMNDFKQYYEGTSTAQRFGSPAAGTKPPKPSNADQNPFSIDNQVRIDFNPQPIKSTPSPTLETPTVEPTSTPEPTPTPDSNLAGDTVTPTPTLTEPPIEPTPTDGIGQTP